MDRNEKNLTFGDRKRVTQLGLSETVRIGQTTRRIVRSFRRPDVRVRRRLASKYWKRATNRSNQILHAATNLMLEDVVRNGAAFALEDLNGTRKMYQKGNGQGTDYRFRLSSWPYSKAYRMLEYKSAWKGVIFIPLTKAETYGSSMECASCGERLREPERKDEEHGRMLWCQSCKIWVDRDVNATIILSERGRSRFDRSLPPRRPVRSPATVILLAGERKKG